MIQDCIHCFLESKIQDAICFVQNCNKGKIDVIKTPPLSSGSELEANRYVVIDMQVLHCVSLTPDISRVDNLPDGNFYEIYSEDTAVWDVSK